MRKMRFSGHPPLTVRLAGNEKTRLQSSKQLVQIGLPRLPA